MTIFCLAEVSIEEIDSKGLLLQKMGNVYTHDKAIRLIIDTPHNEYVKQQEFISKSINMLSGLRNMSNNFHAFDNVIYELNLILNTITEINFILSNNSPRTKREASKDAWYIVMWDFVSGCLCGSDESERITLIAKLLNNQTEELIKTVVSIQAKNEHTDTKVQSIIEKLNELVEDINLNGAKTGHEMEVNNLIQLLTFAIIRYKSFQNKIMNYILENEPVHLDPEIFPLSIFRSILDEIDKRTNESDILPWRLEGDHAFINWYQIIQMTVSVNENYITTEIDIPLISTIRREIYEAIPAPFPIDNSLYFVKTEAPYFITDLGRNEIGFLSSSDFNKCVRKNRNNYFCPKDFPIYLENEENSFCELAILLKQQEKSEYCVAVPLKARDMFIKINDFNQYYFVVFKPMIIKVNCNNNFSNEVINGTGILTINDGCNIYNNFVQITPQTVTKVRTLNKFIVSKFTPYVQTNKRIIFKYEMGKNELDILDKNFEDIKTSLTENRKQGESATIQSFKLNKYNFGWGIPIVIFILYCYCKCKKGTDNNINVNLHQQPQQ